jgi:outer membrane biosynthesis protein TonB
MAKQDGENGRGREQRGDTGAVWGTGIGRRRPRPDRRAVLGSITFHVLLLAGLYAAGLHRATLPEFEVYRVQLRSPPPQVAAETQVVTPPAPDPIVVREAPPTQPERPRPTPPEEPKPEPPKVTPPVETPPRPVKTPEKAAEDPPKEATQSAGRNADERSTGGENIDVDMEGREFPYPEYLQNVIAQLHRHFRWAGNPNLQAEVAFYIQRDGSVGGITVSRKSGDFNFDMEAMAAVEQVGRRGLFGPLPEGWVADRLWIRFRFLPPGT